MAQASTKKIVFWIITVLFPFLLLALVEIGLRVGGYNKEAQPLFVEAPNDSNFLISNSSFISRYFPSFIPQIAPNAFRKEKRPNTFRVFVFGGSSTQGFPYNFYYSFSEQLEQKLVLETDGLNIEVVNLGMTAVNSYVIRDLSKRILPYEPDAVVIYAGHNEYYGSFGVGTTQFGLVNNIGLKRLVIKLKNLRLYQLLENAMKPDNPDAGDNRTLMAKVVSESNIELDSPLFDKGIQQFEKNIGDVLELYERNDIPVYIGTVASNLKDQAPFTDQEDAASAFREAESLFAQADTMSAVNKYKEAKELDGIRFRAPDKINEVIRSVAEEHKAKLVDIEALLRAQSSSGIEDESLFIDHLHPDYKGHRLMATLFFEHLLEVEKLKRAYRPNSFDLPDAISTFEETYSNTAISRLLVGYPFQKGLTQDQELAEFQKIYQGYLQASYIDSIAAHAARNQRLVPEALTEVINKAQSRNDTLAVITHYYELLKWQLNSVNLIEKGIDIAVKSRIDDNYTVYMVNQVLNDGLQDPRYMDVLSAVYIMNQDLDKARYWLEKSEGRGSNAPMLFYNFARYHILTGDTLRASEYYSKYVQASQAN
ncbi:MAG: hypothetical protein ED557_08010 [Balneola sp.]|nr:MAG: hypothetical protein ED557_08010 [Balneola sp.]